MCFAPQRRALFRHLNFQKWSEAGVFCTCSLRNVLRATTACTFSTSQLPKVVRSWCVLYIFTSKCASRHNGVHFFDISTSKSGPKLVCFVHFHFEMCFAPQRRALFRHLNFQKWSEAGVFCTFSLRNVLRATTACTFSTSQLPKVVRSWCVLYIFTSKCASRHNGVHFFDISTSKVVRSWCVLYMFTSKCASRHNGVHFFRHLNFQKWSEAGVFCDFFTSKCASRHNGVQIFDNSTSKSGPKLVCFVHFHFEMCFAPQRRALFRHLNFQKWSQAGVFCTCSLRNVLRATTACTFSTSQLPKSGPKLVCFVHFHFEMCFAPQRRALFRHLNFQKWSEAGVFCTCSLRNVLRATTACTFSTSQLPKVVRSWCVFVHFHFEMCFAPQRRALFRHLNFQKWSEAGVFCTFSLRNVLRATAACTFSTSQLPKVVRSWCVLYMFTSKCASRHNGVHFFDISTSKSGPKLRNCTAKMPNVTSETHRK